MTYEYEKVGWPWYSSYASEHVLANAEVQHNDGDGDNDDGDGGGRFVKRIMQNASILRIFLPIVFSCFAMSSRMNFLVLWLRTISATFNIILAATLRGFTAGGAIRIAHYDVIDDVITRKL